MNRNLCLGLVILSLVVALGTGSYVLDKKAAVQAAGVQAPMFEVDPMWPKPLPNHWIIGMTIGVSVDAQDHIWIIHRGGSLEAKESYANTNPPGADCCVTAPPVLEFDKAATSSGTGAVPARATIGPTRTMESRSTTKATSGSAATAAHRSQNAGKRGQHRAGGEPAGFLCDNQILKFTQDGKFLMQIGHPARARAATTSKTSRVRRRCSSIRRPMNYTSPTVTAINA